MIDFCIRHAGDAGLLVVFGKEIDLELNRMTAAFSQFVEARGFEGFIETVPAYCSVLVIFDPDVISIKEAEKELNKLRDAFMEKANTKVIDSAVKDSKENDLAASDVSAETSSQRVVTIPCLYGGEYGPDLSEMAEALGMTEEEVIEIHTSREYPVYMLGFLPGFAYLGGLSERIHMPRLNTPRTKIPAGSVGIGGAQTGVYPMESPGGWRLLGRTPIRLYDADREEPILLRAGDLVRFQAIDETEFKRLEALENEKSLKNRKKASDQTAEPTFRVSSPGPLTTVQDLGRHGYLKAGIGECGAMDRQAVERANHLLGNPKKAAVLEATLLGPTLEFLKDTEIAVTGANVPVLLDGVPCSMNQVISVKAGNVLSFSFAAEGCRIYIAMKGGIDVPMVMGSRSTDIKSHIGGYQGRKLQAGDELALLDINALDRGAGESRKTSGSEKGSGHNGEKFGEKNGLISGFMMKLKALLTRDKKDSAITLEASALAESDKTASNTTSIGAVGSDGTVTIRVVLGPQDEYFTDQGIETFLKEVYTVTAQSDRMGIRLDGEKIESKNGTDIISDGIVFGSIQIPKEGKPIILMADHQTAGGYAKIATVVTEDLSKLAQMRPGAKLRFVL